MSDTTTSLPTSSSSTSPAYTLSQLQSILNVAEEAARLAGAIILQHAGNIDIDKEKAGYQDLVTAADKACQNIIEETIKNYYPDHNILGEESVEAGYLASTAAINNLLTTSTTTSSSPSSSSVTSPWLWIIDPIDGTTNFIHGVPCSVVSIGIAYNGIMVVGCIYEPYRNEMFTAIQNQGTYLNKKRVKVSNQETKLSQALLGYGLHHTHLVGNLMIQGLSIMLLHTRGCRSLGSAALHLAYVSCGRLTGFWELDLAAWDIAAGSLLVMEAGGKITDTQGNPYTLRTRNTLATNGKEEIHNEIVRLLKEKHADHVPR